MNVNKVGNVVVEWLDYSPVTQEPGVRLPSNWRESGVFKLMWHPPGGHGINYTSGTAVTWRVGMTATLTK